MLTFDPPAGVAVGYLAIAAAIAGVAGFAFVVAGLAALLRAKPLGFTVRTLCGALLLALGALAATIAIGVQGYHALAREETAARIAVRPTGPQRFEATFRFPDGRSEVYQLAGDEIYVDAHVLKWKPAANVLGLHTLWSLDRVAGRYRSIEQERSAPRTLHALQADRPIDLYELRNRFGQLARLYDAEHGSASFVPVSEPAEFELRVTTSGLLIRRLPR
ncbi:MAG TPA: hypothetical protein VM491_12425 [Burkholderiaceae bacterium]|nr:hypothetical protein [Burkholderiaceae bacterium]